MIEISKRLQIIASCIPKGSVVADIGTDHAYLPIYLIQNKSAESVIAMDVKRGPLKRAAKNISEAGCAKDIELRLSDGLSQLKGGEASVIIMSGIGGKLMERLLSEGRDKLTPDTMLILSPQSELLHFRKYLFEENFVTEDEKMLKEGGKYYVIIICHIRDIQTESASDKCSIAGSGCSKITAYKNASNYPYEVIRYAELKYGKILIDGRDKILHEFAQSELLVYQQLKAKLELSSSFSAQQRIVQIDKQIQAVQYVLGLYNR